MNSAFKGPISHRLLTRWLKKSQEKLTSLPYVVIIIIIFISAPWSEPITLFNCSCTDIIDHMVTFFYGLISLELHYLAFKCKNKPSKTFWVCWAYFQCKWTTGRAGFWLLWGWHTHTCTLLFTDLRPALALPLLGIIAVCLVAWIHRRGTLNISNQCVWRAWAWRSYTYTGKLHLALLIFLLYCVPLCVSICAST